MTGISGANVAVHVESQIVELTEEVTKAVADMNTIKEEMKKYEKSSAEFKTLQNVKKDVILVM